MKLNGEVAGVRREPVVFKRGGKDIVLWVEAQQSFDEFNKLCPLPEPPEYKQPGNKPTIKDVKDPEYVKALNKRGDFFSQWLVVASLGATPGLEWEKVKPSEMGTWKFWQEELRDFGLAELELAHIIRKVNQVNALSSSELDEAVESFLAESAQENQE
jgi:hypothetical protein